METGQFGQNGVTAVLAVMVVKEDDLEPAPILRHDIMVDSV